MALNTKWERWIPQATATLSLTNPLLRLVSMAKGRIATEISDSINHNLSTLSTMMTMSLTRLPI